MIVVINDSQRLIFIAAPAMVARTNGIFRLESNPILQDVAHTVPLPQSGKKDIADSVFNSEAGENISHVVDVDIIFSR